MSYWEQDSSLHLYAPTYRDRIKKAWKILTTGQTVYRFSFHYRFPEGEGAEQSVYIDDRRLIPLPPEEDTT